MTEHVMSVVTVSKSGMKCKPHFSVNLKYKMVLTVLSEQLSQKKMKMAK
jgi:hypothetical protein